MKVPLMAIFSVREIPLFIQWLQDQIREVSSQSKTLEQLYIKKENSEFLLRASWSVMVPLWVLCCCRWGAKNPEATFGKVPTFFNSGMFLLCDDSKKQQCALICETQLMRGVPSPVMHYVDIYIAEKHRKVSC